jgi:hypothetical protein
MGMEGNEKGYGMGKKDRETGRKKIAEVKKGREWEGSKGSARDKGTWSVREGRVGKEKSAG